jgi:plastocyanin
MSVSRISRAFYLVAPMLTLAATRPSPRIVQKNKAFSQTEIHIRAGDSVVFVNADEVSHNAFSSTAGLKFNLKRQAPATSAAVPFPNRGTADVRCAFHPNMKLKIIVE